MAALRAAWRLVRGVAHAIAGWCTIAFTFPRLTQAERDERVSRWARRMLGIFGIDLHVRGTPPALGPMLLVANHISWLDILVMHAARHCRFVAKSEVERWPLIGTLATGGGTLYIERESRRHAMHVVHDMAQALRGGQVLAVFPEGTTSDGVALLPFHANLLQAAISAGAPAQPVALSYVDAASSRISLAPCYLGDEWLITSLWRTLTASSLQARVSFGDPQFAGTRGRRAWAAELRESVASLRESSCL